MELSLENENLVIICWFYVKNYIFVHMTDKNFPVTGPLWGSLAPNGRPEVEVLESSQLAIPPWNNAVSTNYDHPSQNLKRVT